jgi:ribosomal protein S18 acetylase RimI-like enzyme
MTGPVTFATDTAAPDAVAAHLQACDASFIPPLSVRVDIDRYARQLCQQGVRFEAWADGLLVGLVAGYCNDRAKRLAYVSNVSVLPAWTGRGIAAELLRGFVAHARTGGFHRVELDVNPGAAPALALYARHGFVVTGARGADLTMSLDLDAAPGGPGPQRPQ